MYNHKITPIIYSDSVIRFITQNKSQIDKLIKTKWSADDNNEEEEGSGSTNRTKYSDNDKTVLMLGMCDTPLDISQSVYDLIDENNFA
jgi:hypothetical protein